MARLLIGVPLVVQSIAYGATAQDTVSVLIRVEDGARIGVPDRVVAYDPRTRAVREVYRTEGEIRDEAAVSLDGRYVSLIEIVKTQTRSEERLVVLHLSGQIARVVANKPIAKYVWCCGNDKIAVISGRAAEEGIGFMPEGVSVLDVATGAERTLGDIPLPYQLHWASFDSSLYIKGLPPPSARGARDARPIVYRYEVSTDRLSATTRRGAFFSPDGSYYFDPSVEGSEFRLYRAADDQDVTARLRLPEEQVRWGPEGGWMPGAGHALVFIEKPARETVKPGQPRQPPRLIDPSAAQVHPERWNVALDAETGRVIDRFQGDIEAGWKTNGTALPVERRTGVELIPSRRP